MHKSSEKIVNPCTSHSVPQDTREEDGERAQNTTIEQTHYSWGFLQLKLPDTMVTLTIVVDGIRPRAPRLRTSVRIRPANSRSTRSEHRKRTPVNHAGDLAGEGTFCKAAVASIQATM